MWTHRAWRDLRPARGARSELSSYTDLCRAVEGNTTFYALPSEDAVLRWRADTPEDFRFCFKLPKEVTHERRLRGCGGLLAEFVDRLSPLADRMGPVWIQLPAAFGDGRDDLAALGHFLDALPDAGLAWAVEVRNRSFEADGDGERALNDLLFGRGVDRVIIDTRSLFAGPCRTAEEIEAWERKPRLRVRPVALGTHPTLRFVGQSDAEITRSWWQPWVDKVASWLVGGREPYVFLHTPDNVETPSLCRRFHTEVAERVPGLAPLPDSPETDEQLSIF